MAAAGLPLVIVGGGHAAASAARELRTQGHEAPVIVISDEPHLPYERPALSKEVLRDGLAIEQLYTLSPDWYLENAVETRLGSRVVEVRAGEGAVVLDDGSRLRADGVLLATGSTPRRLPFADHERIRYLSTYEDARAIRAFLQPGDRMVIVGAGFIGAEVAAAARGAGVEVVMLEALTIPFSRALGAEVGHVIASIHRSHGVDVRAGDGVVALQPQDAEVLVTTSRGDRFAATVVVVGIGVLPRDQLAADSGIQTSNGIVVGPGLQTSVDRVFAAGDVVSHAHPLFGHRVRVEHYDSAVKQGAVAALNLLGGDAVHADPPWFWSDQYDHNLQFVGHSASYDEVILRGSPDEGAFSAFFIKAGRLAGCFGLNRGGEVRLALRLVGVEVSAIERELADDSVELRAVVRGLRATRRALA